MLDSKPPIRAPKRERLAIQDPSSDDIVISCPLTRLLSYLVSFCKDAKAGDEYPLHKPTEKGPNDTASTVRT